MPSIVGVRIKALIPTRAVARMQLRSGGIREISGGADPGFRFAPSGLLATGSHPNLRAIRENQLKFFEADRHGGRCDVEHFYQRFD